MREKSEGEVKEDIRKRAVSWYSHLFTSRSFSDQLCWKSTTYIYLTLMTQFKRFKW